MAYLFVVEDISTVKVWSAKPLRTHWKPNSHVYTQMHLCDYDVVESHPRKKNFSQNQRM